MSSMVSYFLVVFTGFFAIMNPIANTPIFLALTSDDDHAVRKTIASRSLMLAFVIIFFFSLLGKVVFELFSNFIF